MERNSNSMYLRDCLEKVSLKLTALHSTLCVLELGLETEGIEKQALHVLQCMESSVSDLCIITSECLKNTENEDIPP